MSKLSFVLATLLVSSLSFAQSAPPAPTVAPPPPPMHHGGHHPPMNAPMGGPMDSMDGGRSCEQCYYAMSQQPARWTLTFSPAYFHQNRENINPAFTSNGFSSARQDLFGYELEIRKQLDSGFQWGIEYLRADTDREQGNNRAAYGTGMFGLYLGYRVLNTGRFTVDIGSGIGGARTELEVFSGSQNGRLRENAWYAQPTLGVAYTVSRHLRLGVSGSYLAPFGQDEDITGQDLVVRDLALQGFSAKIDLILGRF